MGNKNLDMEVNASKKNIDMKEQVRSGTNNESPNVTGAGETSRNYKRDDVGLPNADVQDPHRARETGRADTDINSDVMRKDRPN